MKNAVDAVILKGTFRESDIIARFHGDEFVVLTIGSSEKHAEILTDRLQRNIEAHNMRGDRGYTLSMSVGNVQYDPEDPCSLDELLAKADKLMYAQKRRR